MKVNGKINKEDKKNERINGLIGLIVQQQIDSFVIGCGFMFFLALSLVETPKPPTRNKQHGHNDQIPKLEFHNVRSGKEVVLR